VAGGIFDSKEDIDIQEGGDQVREIEEQLCDSSEMIPSVGNGTRR